MALTRKMLKAMGIEDDKVDQIIEAHAETVDGLKADISKYKGDAEKLPSVQKELDDIKAAGDGGWESKAKDWEKKYNDLVADNQKKETQAAKEKAYRGLLKEAGVADKRIESIMKVTKMDDITLDKDGKIKDAETLKTSIKTEWSDFISTSGAKGAPTQTPPTSNGGTGSGKTRDEILSIRDGAVRRSEMVKNAHLFPEIPTNNT